MYDDEDKEILKKVKSYSARKKKTFNSAINSKNLTDEEMDEWFLNEQKKMARIRRSKTNTKFFMDIPKGGDANKRWKKSDDDESLEIEV